MELLEHPIGDELDGAVESMFHLRHYNPSDPVERIVPDGSTNLVIELDDQARYVLDSETRERRAPCSRSWFSGIQRHHMLISVPANSELIAVRFRPGRAFSVVGRSMAELSSQVTPARLVLGDAVDSLRRDLVESEPATRLALVEGFLETRQRSEWAPPTSLIEAVTTITRAPTVTTIKGLCAELGISDTHLSTLFRKHVGVAPKTFQQIMRFSAALAAIQRSETVDWSQVSLECGYYDQSHFIRDFKRFSGFQPSEFASRDHDRTNFFPDT